MRRMISWTLLAVVLVTLASFGPALAQDANGPATIITFTSTVPFISVADVEAGGTVTTLSWVAVGLDDDQRLILERYELNGFVSMLTPEESAFIEEIDAMPWTTEFLTNFKPTAGDEIMKEGMLAAMTRFGGL